MPILYSFRRCPYAMRARLALAASGLAFELREVVLKNKPAELLTASPKGTVPVLALPSGEVIDESLGIMRWALEQNDPNGWLKNGPAEDVLAIIEGNDSKFKNALDRYKYPSRYPQESGGDATGFAVTQRHIAAQWLAELELRLSGDSSFEWVFGHQASLADIAILPFVRQFAHTDKAWFAEKPWPQLQAWLARFEASAIFDSVMGKHVPWRTAA